MEAPKVATFGRKHQNPTSPRDFLLKIVLCKAVLTSKFSTYIPVLF